MASNRGVAYIEPGVVEIQSIDYPKLVMESWSLLCTAESLINSGLTFVLVGWVKAHHSTVPWNRKNT